MIITKLNINPDRATNKFIVLWLWRSREFSSQLDIPYFLHEGNIIDEGVKLLEYDIFVIR